MIALLPLLLACEPRPAAGVVVPLGERHTVVVPHGSESCWTDTADVWIRPACARDSLAAVFPFPPPGARTAGPPPGAGDLRNPWSLRLWFAALPRDLGCLDRPRLAGRLAWYCPREEEGGSGGPERFIEGWTRLEGDEILAFSFSQQAEWPSEVDADALWSVIASVRPR